MFFVEIQRHRMSPFLIYHEDTQDTKF
jgi:hypothetical protein